MNAVLSKLRMNVDTGKCGCVDLSVPAEYLLTRDMQLLLEVMEYVISETREQVGAYLVRFPHYTQGMDRIVGNFNFVDALCSMQRSSGVPFILDAKRCTEEELEWVLRCVQNILVVREEGKGLTDYGGLVYHFTPKKVPRSISLVEELNRNISSAREALRKTEMGEETIILISEYRDEFVQLDAHGRVMFLLNEAGSLPVVHLLIKTLELQRKRILLRLSCSPFVIFDKAS